MKITKIDYDENEAVLTVWTDAVENTGFNFNIGEIAGEGDLKEKVRTRVIEFLTGKTDRATKKALAETYKSLEGKEI